VTRPTAAPIDRGEAILAIRAALRARSNRSWSVRGGRGTSWGWITIIAAPKRLVDGFMTDDDRAELAGLLGLDSVHGQGELIPASSAHRREYLARAQGREPAVRGEPYWD
jgi:hypothetical protein